MSTTNISAGAHRTRFLARKRRQTVQQYALAFYLAALMATLLSLQSVVGDSAFFPLVTYCLISSFVVLVCATNYRCCSAHRTVYRPIPECRLQSSELDGKGTDAAAAADVIFVILDDKTPLAINDSGRRYT